jgi:cytochrome P450
VAEIDQIVFDLIHTRRKCQDRPDDVLSRLLAAHEAGGEIQLNDKELRDATVTLLLAGHETTANALSWAFIHASNGFETAEPAHIFSEVIRLYPSIWIIERRVIRDDTIGGYHIPRGSSVLISPYLLHRHSDFWPEPDRFDPSRFVGDHPRLRDGYLPFGLGPHRCVGLYLANKIAAHVIERVFSRFRLRLLPDQQIGTTPGITLRHTGPVKMTVACHSPG